MQLLVTGGAGFIGSNYVRWLLANTDDTVVALDALTYAGNLGIDVVNMSYYVDPWLYNCASNPAARRWLWSPITCAPSACCSFWITVST